MAGAVSAVPSFLRQKSSQEVRKVEPILLSSTELPRKRVSLSSKHCFTTKFHNEMINLKQKNAEKKKSQHVPIIIGTFPIIFYCMYFLSSISKC